MAAPNEGYLLESDAHIKAELRFKFSFQRILISIENVPRNSNFYFLSLDI